jgi:putative inorganic carbon (HCO3(-)) transporter
MKEKILKLIDLLIEVGWLMIFFLTPLFFVPVVYGTWQISGSFLFQTLVKIIFFFWLVKTILAPNSPTGGPSIQSANWRTKYLKYVLPALVFIFILGLATIFSQSFYYSFWGYYARKMGYLMWLHFFIFFLILFFNLKSKKQIQRIFHTIIITAAVAVIYGFLQILGLDFFRWSESPSLGYRVFSTFGQPNFFASWLLLVLPIIFLIILQAKKPQSLKQIFFRPAFVSLSILTLLILVFTQSRSAWLAFVLMFFFFIIAFSWLKKKKKLSVVFLSFFVLSIIFLIILNLHPLSVKENENFLSVRLKTFSNLLSTGQLRFFWWKNSFDLIKQRPWLGYGLETLNLNSPRYYQPDCAALEGINQVPDRAHNDFLDMLLNAGIFGLLAYLFLLFNVFWLGLKFIFKNPQTPDCLKTQTLVLVLLTGLLGYLFSLQFSFHIIATAIYFWGYLAIVLKIINPKSQIIYAMRDPAPRDKQYQSPNAKCQINVK